MKTHQGGREPSPIANEKSAAIWDQVKEAPVRWLPRHKNAAIKAAGVRAYEDCAKGYGIL